MALKDAPRESRCVLWLTALHLLMMGVFPRHALLLAENGGGGDGKDGPVGDGTHDNTDTRDLAYLLLWPKERLSPPENSAGFKGLPVKAELLQDTILKTFMNALYDVGLLPPKSRGARGWAPPTKARDALLSSAVEAKAARTGGKAPEPSALKGAPLVLALNWLAFCRGRADAKQGRIMAIACCRRFQLARPDQPALLEHFLLEHPVSNARTLDDIYAEISRAFDPKGVAAEALRERDEEEDEEKRTSPSAVPVLAPGNSSSRSSGNNDHLSVSSSSSSFPPSPSGARVQAVYTFLRFVEMRLETTAESTSKPKSSKSSKSAASAAMATGIDTLDSARHVLHKSLVGMWTATATTAASSPRSESDRWLQGEEGDELVGRALEGAKASLIRWADGGSDAGFELCARNPGNRRPDGHWRRRCRDVPGRNGERQLSTIIFTLWVLGGASVAIGALDHLLSAESFSSMSAERRRLAWLQRLEAAVVLSKQQVQVRSIATSTNIDVCVSAAFGGLSGVVRPARTFSVVIRDRPPSEAYPISDGGCGKSFR